MIKSRKIKLLKWLAGISVILLMLGISAVTVFAAGDVSSAIESTWTSAQTQIKNVVNNVGHPIKFCVNNNPSSNNKTADCGVIRLSDLPRVNFSFLSAECYARSA